MKKIALIFFVLLGVIETVGAQCGLDIYILNDNSGSVDAVEFQQSKEFVTALATQFLPLGTTNTETRIAIGDWSDANSFTQFDFPNSPGQYTTEFSDIVYYENAPRILNGATDINDAVADASLVAGLPVIPGRNVPQVLVILTDAYDFQVSPGIIPFAQDLHNQGFEIIVMAIDEAIADTELPQIASPGAYFTAGDYQALQDDVLTYAQNLATVGCTFDPPTPRPDLTVVLSNFTIENCLTTPTASVDYQVNNNGAENFSGNLYLSFYDADPRIPGANLVGVYNAGAVSIASGGSSSGTITDGDVAGLLSASNLYAIVNFDGNQAGNEVPVPAVFDESQLASTTPEAEIITINNFSSETNANLGTDCDVAILDMGVTATGGGCEDEVTYTIQVCNNGLVDAALNDLLVDQASGFNLVSNIGFCAGTDVSFSQFGQNITGNNAGDGLSESQLSADGSTMIIGVPAEDNGAITQAGAARVYNYDAVSGQWVQKGQTFLGQSAPEQLGRSVDISADGNRIVVLSRYGTSPRGKAVVYDWNSGTGQWQQVGNVVNNPTPSNSEYNAVALSDNGQHLVVSRLESSIVNALVEVYELSGGVWMQMGTAITGAYSNEFTRTSYGKAMDISADGNRIFIGGYRLDSNGFTDNGQVQIYNWNGSSWVATSFINGQNTNEMLGWNVSASVDGNTVVTLSYNNGGTRTAKIFIWNGASWIQKGNSIVGTGFSTVALSGDGNRLSVGRPTLAHLYEFDGNQWVLIETFGGLDGYETSIDGDGNIVVFGDESQNSSTGLIQIFSQDPCTIAPGECVTAEYTYDVSGAAADTYDFDVVLDASPVDPSHADPIINPDKNFTTQNGVTTGDGWDGSNHSEDDVTIYSSAFCSSTHTIDIAVSIDPSSVCEDGYATATVTITNPYPNGISGTNLEIDLGNGATYASEPYNRSGIVLPTFPGLDGTAGSHTIPVYTLAPGTNTFDVDIAVAAGINTFSVQVTDIDPAYNNGSATTSVVSDNVTGQSAPTISGSCPADVTSGTTTISLNYTVSGASSILWTSGTSGAFSSPNNGSTTYTITPQDEANGFVNFALNAQTAAGCDNTITCRVNISNVDRDYGDAPITFDLNETTIPVAAAHTLTSGLHLGTVAPDAEAANQPSVNADTEAEDDGLTITSIPAAGAPTYQLPVEVTNTTGEAAYVNAFIDWNEDGDFLDAMESGVSVAVPANSGTESYTVNFDVPGSVVINAPVYIRIRVSEEELAVNKSYGAAAGGEVEDHYLLTAAACVAGDNAPLLAQTTFNPPQTVAILIPLLSASNMPPDTQYSVHTTSSATETSQLTQSDTLYPSTTYYVAFWDSLYECYSPVTAVNISSVTCLGEDTDGDGITDDCDLDDDNDGILDTDECTTINEIALFHLFDSNKSSTSDFLRLYKQYIVGGTFVCPLGATCPTDGVGLPYAETDIDGALPTSLAYGNGKYYVVDANGDLLYTDDIVTGNFINLGNAQIGGYKNLAFDNGVFYHWFNNSGTLELYSSADPVGLGWTNEGTIVDRTEQFTDVGNGHDYELKDIAVYQGIFYFMYYTEDVNSNVNNNDVRTKVYTSSLPTSATPNWQDEGTTWFGYQTYNIAYGSEDVFAACDEDGDGIPNHLDMDSDDDGCPDALEGDGSFTDTDLDTDDRLIGSDADSDGLIDGSQQDIGNSQDNSIADCNCPNISGIDSDEDGVDDVCDLDDDNDGILDSEECPVVYSVSPVTTSSVTVNGTITSGTAQQLVDGEGAGGSGAGPFPYWYTNETNLPLEFSMDMQTPSTIDHIKLYSPWGIDEWVSEFTVELYDNSNVLLGMESLTAPDQYSGTPILSFSQEYTNVSSIEFTIISGQEYNSFDRVSLNEIVFLDLQACDTDNDGIPNHLDFDSDNDGCPDAIEGDGTYNYDDVEGNGSINITAYPVDDDGVPNNGTSQGIGSSQDDSVQATECDPCDPSSTLFVDSDGDDVADFCDLDDDNDGIMDTVECSNTITDMANAFAGGTMLDIVPSDFGLALNTKNQNVTADLSDKFGYSANSGAVIISISNASVHPTEDAWWTKDGEQPSVWNVTGSLSAFVLMAQDTRYYGDDSKTIHIYDAAPVIPIMLPGQENQTAIAGQWSIIDTPAQKSLNDLDNNTSTNEFGNWRFANMNFGPKMFGFSTTTAFGDPTYAVLMYLECDADMDAIPNRLDLDSDNDNCLDAYEGDGAFTEADLVDAGGTVAVGTGSSANNQNLCADGSCVDANGIPTVAGTGQGIGLSQNAAESGCYCTQPGLAGTTTEFTQIGVSDRNGDAAGWPGTIPNGFIAIESEDSGFVITRVTQASDIANPVEGMLVYDITDQCVKLYNGTVWHCLERSCNQ